MEQRQSEPNVTQNPEPSPSADEPSLHASPPSAAQIDPIGHYQEVPTTPKPQKRLRSTAFKGFWSFGQLIFGAVLLAFVINHVVFQSYEVFGQSMAPTLHEGDRLIISKLGKSWSSLLRRDYLPKRGEIIVFHNPQSADVQLVKRVVGLPGDIIIVRDGQLFVTPPDGSNTFNFDDVYGLDLVGATDKLESLVPAGKVFVVGDNRIPGGSLDSRNDLGTVPLGDIVGDLVLRIYPLGDAGVF
ncbi:MAG TPA: signal peptidase I [Candidatus Saccharimonadales bacterium]